VVKIEVEHETLLLYQESHIQTLKSREQNSGSCPCRLNIESEKTRYTCGELYILSSEDVHKEQVKCVKSKFPRVC
jgi:hypothetical protein